MTFFRRVTDRARDDGDQRTGQRGESRYEFAARFSATDAMLLRELVGQVAELVAGPPQAPTGMPGDTDVAAAPGGASLPHDVPTGEMTRGDLADALGLTDDAALPDDPALARLLPDAYPDDPDASNEFRRYTERDLRSAKVAAAETVLATLPEGGGRIRLSQQQAEVWLRSLNDIRLALGVRLGITEDLSGELARIKPDDHRYAVLAVYDWLSGMQESLVHALS